MTRDTRWLFAVLALCCVLFATESVTLYSEQGVRVTPTPEPLTALGGKWVQLWHGQFTGTVQITVPVTLEPTYPPYPDWAIINVRLYAESENVVTLRVAGVTHWVQGTEGPVSFHADVVRQGGVWAIDCWASAPVFVDLWAVL